MTHTILITQCLQNDFVAPVEAHARLPNALHVGRTEALRLLGHDPASGPLAQLMGWARARPKDRITLVHVRDHHDPSDPAQRDHLATFGAHCLKDSEGEAFVPGIAGEMGENEFVVDATGLNDFEGTTLEAVLAKARAHGDVRVGVVGVWTDAKVTFLLYDLRTRLGLPELATCSALTASASRTQHFYALDQLRRVLGVHVLDGVGDFAEWLMPGEGKSIGPVAMPRYEPKMRVVEGDPAPEGDDRALVAYLFRDSAEVELDALAGGFSGSSVYRVEARDALGHAQAPSVVKIGPRALIAKERVAFEHIESVLGNSAPTVRGFVDLGERAAIKFAFASMGKGNARTLKSLYEGGAELGELESVIREVFEDVLGRLYAAARYEPLPLLDYYTFAEGQAAWIGARVREIMGEGTGDELHFGHGLVLPNVVGFYERDLSTLCAPPGESHYVSYVHGDLNTANVLVDGRDNVWVIDFAHAHRGHVLRDVAKLENDLLYILTRVEDEATFEEALALTTFLRSVEDLRAPLPERLEGLHSDGMKRSYAVLRVLRSLVAELCREDRDPTQLRIALLRYAGHTLSFDESSPWQKKWALAAACGHALDITNAYRRARTLRLDEVPVPGVVGKLALTICPGRRDRDRELVADIAAMQAFGAKHFVTLVTDDELEWAGVPELVTQTRAEGIAVHRLPTPDQRAPSHEDASALVGLLDDALHRGENVVVACMGGLGRSGLVAACLLTRHGMSAHDAIEAVRAARDPRAVETAEQEQFVARFAVTRITP